MQHRPSTGSTRDPLRGLRLPEEGAQPPDWLRPKRPESVERKKANAELRAENHAVARSRGWGTAYWKRSARDARWSYRRARARAALRSAGRCACRTPRPRARARRAARRGKTRAGPGSDDGGSEPEPPSPLAVARAEALAERLSRAEIRLDEGGLARLRDIGLGGRRLDQALQVLVADGRAEIVRWGPIVVLRQRGEGE